MSNSTTYPPAGFCATLACAQGTATREYWEGVRAQTGSSTTASNGNGGAAKEGPCGVKWCRDVEPRPKATIIPRASQKPSDFLLKNPFHLSNNLNGSNLMAQGFAAFSSGCERKQLQVVCYDFSPGGDQPMTIGDVLFYPKGYDDLDDVLENGEPRTNRALDAAHGDGYSAKFGRNLLAHEAVHSGQWAGYRDARDFLKDYSAEVAKSYAKSGDAARLNSFEMGANLYWGGYLNAGVKDEAPTDKGAYPKMTWYWLRSDVKNFFENMGKKATDPFEKLATCRFRVDQYGRFSC
ncbi:hypothetical protein AB0E96_30305 [Kitasatospora sp. NPDC036755]|uniref:hypothetical protein n=1 Tax=Kitasatospora sp. NPDC036755 TaxID=3154600 RepID=UPI0033F72DE9